MLRRRSRIVRTTASIEDIERAIRETSLEPPDATINTPIPNPRKRPAPPPTPPAVAASQPKRRRSTATPARRASHAPDSQINVPPAEQLDVYVFGSNAQAELGLGPDVDSRPVARPLLHPLLGAARVVQIAVGGQHCVALTRDGRVLTWGANDLGALGRDTAAKASGWEDEMVVEDGDVLVIEGDGDTLELDGGVDSGEDDDSEEEGALNPREATPMEVDLSALKGDPVTYVAASDNASFVVTGRGFVFGWGTFRDNQGLTTFAPGVELQKCPLQIASLSKVTKLATGTNHVLALTNDGAVYAWGNSDQDQLGRRIGGRHKVNGLIPTCVKLPKDIVDIGAGSYHSFAIDRSGVVYSWGANNFGQTGHAQGLGESDTSVIVPAPVKGLEGHGAMVGIAGGEHHSIAVTDNGSCLVWGRLDGSQTGLNVPEIPEENVVRDEYGRRRILKAATKIPGLQAAKVDAGIDCCIVVTTAGDVYSWGFSESYRTGQGTEDDVDIAKQMVSKSIKDGRISWAALGGQFGIIVAKSSSLP